MDFRILGPVELIVDDVPVRLGGRRPQAVLGMLLLRANEHVSATELAQAIWADDPPASAPANLRTYLAELRRLLGRHDPHTTRLVTGAGGARLTVADAELDATRFTAAVTRASAVAERDARAATTLLRDAMALWRGPVADGIVHGPLFEAEAARLHELRARAVEDLADLLGRLGEHGSAADELRKLVRTHPLRERAWARLMTALWRHGDTAAALDAYRRATSSLVTELGVEPTAELRKLHRAILAGDREAPPQQPAEPAPAPARPRQVPRRLPRFVGREPELARLVAHLTEPRPAGVTGLAVVHGAAGIGKSALATEVAHRVAPSYPGGCLYVELRGSAGAGQALEPEAVLGRFLRALGSSDDGCADVAEAATRFRSATAGRGLLVLLDDAADAHQIRPLLPADAGCAALVTSRRRLVSLDGAEHVDLGALSEAESVALLAQSTGEQRVRSEAGAAAAIVDRCGRLPLAVRIAGGRLAARPSWSLGAFAQRLADAGRTFDELRVDDLAMWSSFDVTYRALRGENRPAATAFCLLGAAHLPTFAAPAVASLVPPGGDADVVVERLAGIHLIEPAGAGRYRMHDLIRLYAAERAAADVPEDERDAATTRLLQHYRATLVDMAARIARQPDHGATTWLRDECDVMLALVRRHADAAERTAPVVGAIADNLLPYLDSARHRRDLIEVSTIAVRLAERRGDTAAMAAGQLALAWGHATTDLQTARRSAHRGMELYRSIGDVRGEAAALRRIGGVHKRMRELDTAARWLRLAATTSRRAGDAVGEAASLDNLGIVYQEAGAFDDALRCHEQGQEIAAAAGEAQLESLCLLNAANVYRLTGRITDAVMRYRRAVDVCRRFGNQRGEASALLGLGVCLGDLGHPDEARRTLELAEATFERLGLPGAAMAREHRARI